jgi:hypothetical protein
MILHKTRPPAIVLALFLSLIPAFPEAEPLQSPTWGFWLDLPETYEYAAGNGRDRFSFRSAEGAALDLAVYGPGAESSYPSPEALAEDLQRRLGNRGDTSYFEYRGRKAALLELAFPDPSNKPSAGGAPGARLEGWAFCVELDPAEGSGGRGAKPLLAALAYGPAGTPGLQVLHLSALDSIAPARGDRLAPGPVTEFSYPREKPKRAALGDSGLSAVIDEVDAEAAQALVDREFAVLRGHASTPRWKEAWKRFYRAVYRDSFDRLADAAFVLERSWQTGEGRRLAEKALAWVQSFRYERDLMGSDFVNLVSAALEGRGDCDSRAMLWAVILERANIPAAIMVSREYNHAMGLADLSGGGARFEMEGVRWVVAETTDQVALGLIGADTADSAQWLGISF